MYYAFTLLYFVEIMCNKVLVMYILVHILCTATIKLNSEFSSLLRVELCIFLVTAVSIAFNGLWYARVQFQRWSVWFPFHVMYRVLHSLRMLGIGRVIPLSYGKPRYFCVNSYKSASCYWFLTFCQLYAWHRVRFSLYVEC